MSIPANKITSKVGKPMCPTACTRLRLKPLFLWHNLNTTEPVRESMMALAAGSGTEWQACLPAAPPGASAAQGWCCGGRLARRNRRAGPALWRGQSPLSHVRQSSASPRRASPSRSRWGAGPGVGPQTRSAGLADSVPLINWRAGPLAGRLATQCHCCQAARAIMALTLGRAQF